MQIDIIPAKELDRYIGIKEYEIIDLRDDEEYRSDATVGHAACLIFAAVVLSTVLRVILRTVKKNF